MLRSLALRSTPQAHLVAAMELIDLQATSSSPMGTAVGGSVIALVRREEATRARVAAEVVVAQRRSRPFILTC